MRDANTNDRDDAQHGMNVFDLVVSHKTSSDAENESSNPSPEAHTAKRVCNFRYRWGTSCDLDAMPGSLVCEAHAGGKISLIALRKKATSLGPLFIKRLEEIVETGEPLEVVAAMKQWTEFVGIKDLPAIHGSGLDEDELNASRESLGRKLDQLADKLVTKKTA